MAPRRTRAELEGHEFKEVSLVALRSALSELVSEVAYTDHELLITRNGKRVAALISMRAFHVLQERVEELENAIDRAAATRRPRRKARGQSVR